MLHNSYFSPAAYSMAAMSSWPNRLHLTAEGPVVIKGKHTIHGMGGVGSEYDYRAYLLAEQPAAPQLRVATETLSPAACPANASPMPGHPRACRSAMR